jgi:Putative restriction endonuclease
MGGAADKVTFYTESPTSLPISDIWKMFVTEDPPVYKPDRTYTIKEFEAINNWLKTHDLTINDQPISHFDLDSQGKLIPVSQTPILREVAVGEILAQLANWNILTRQNGVCTTSQGGFNFSTSRGRTITAPDVAFTPRKTYRNLDQRQLLTFQGVPFSPTFAVEVEDVSAPTKLEELTTKFKTVFSLRVYS